MNGKEFDELVNKQLAVVRETLASKGEEYVPEGEPTRFHNFDVSAAFNQQLRTEALWGFLTKHLVSLSDMVKTESTDSTLAKWDEKITDSIVYLLLLKGIVTEEAKAKIELVEVEAQRQAPSIVAHKDFKKPQSGLDY